MAAKKSAEKAPPGKKTGTLTDRLRESEKMYRGIFDSGGIPSVVIGEDSLILLANVRFLELCGFSREEIGTLDRARQRVFRVTHGGQERMSCPKCPDRKLTPFNYASTSGIILDKCPGCGGIWLDRGELEMVQALVEDWSGSRH